MSLKRLFDKTGVNFLKSSDKNESLNLEKLNKEVSRIAPILGKIFIPQTKENYPKVLDEIAKTMNDFGLETIQQYFKTIHTQIVQEKISFSELPAETQLFMKSVYYCLDRLESAYPQSEWEAQSNLLKKTRLEVVAKMYGEAIAKVYSEVMHTLENPTVSSEVREQILSNALAELTAVLSPYKITDTRPLFERKADFFKTLPRELENSILLQLGRYNLFKPL